MRRRDFIAGLGAAGSFILLPVGVLGQQIDRVRRVGLLGANSPALQSQWTTAFVNRLHELGWTEGRNLVVDYAGLRDASIAPRNLSPRWTNVDVIVTHATANVVAAKQATSVIPIVFAAVPDPVGDKLVASLARPGGNVTGLSNQADLSPGITSKNG
jgi:putative tryptophan/tyrosine transport system substrate-binding protein